MNKDLLRRKLMEIVSQHKGPENAIKREELVFRLSVWDAELHAMYERDKADADRAVRRLYARLPVASSQAGLYIPRTPEELEGFRDYMIRNYGHERAAIRVRTILAYRPELSASTMKQMPLSGGEA